jgi:threonine dehydratase
MSYNHAIDAKAGNSVRQPVKPIDLEAISAARRRLEGLGLCAPLQVLDAAPPGKRVMLKLENLQPIGSFKIRPIGNAVLARGESELARGIYTTSSGNSALGVAHLARRLGIAASAIVPANAPASKLARLRDLGAHIDVRPTEEWWRAIESGTLADQPGVYIDAVRDPLALAGDATIGTEILAEWPEVEAILVPFGGGGLACGIACAARLLRPDVKVIACELDSAQPLAAALAAGHPVQTPHDAGFVSGVGYGTVLPEMWTLIKGLIHEVVTVSLADTAAAIKTLALRNHVVAEGAGALPVAAALSGRYAPSKVCAVVSGGNLHGAELAAILAGRLPHEPLPGAL